jgi:hypothetical protein
MRRQDVRLGISVKNIEELDFLGAEGTLLSNNIYYGHVLVKYHYIPQSCFSPQSYWTDLESLTVIESTNKKNQRLLKEERK